MSLLSWIILFSLLGGVLSVMAASVFLALPAKLRSRLLPHTVSFAIGALLGAAFLALIPHAVTGTQRIEVHDLGLTILIGVLVFFLLEKMVIWRHCHAEDCDVHGHAHGHSDAHSKTAAQTPEHAHNPAAGTLILLGDGLHNFVDGILIAAAFMTDIHVGIVTSLAVAAHEIPQEVGDFAIMLNSGFSRMKALLFNIAASLATVVGALIAYFSLSDLLQLTPYVLAVAASSFIYIAVADLIPGLHKRSELHVTLQQVVLICAGVVVIYWAHSTLH